MAGAGCSLQRMSLLLLLCFAGWACREGPSTPGRLQAAEAGADDAEAEDAVDEGTDADWVALASAPAAVQREPRALPPVRPAAAAADGDSPGLEERTWAAAAAARRGAATPAGSESIVGPDNRIRVTNTTVAPWRQLGRLVGLVNATEELICTAAMIAPSYLLTAAHCVYLPNTKFIAAGGITYAAGQEDATVTPYGVVTAAQTFVPTGYSTRANADTADDNYNARRMYDWAVIKLQSAVGQQTRYFPRYPNYKNASINMFNAGYPADKSTNAVEMWYSKCVKQRILALAARFSYTCDTDNGNSGGPVWVAQDGKRYLIGIHVAGGTDLNYGTRISTRVEAFIVNAMAKGG